MDTLNSTIGTVIPAAYTSDTTDLYRANFSKIESYLMEIARSGFVSTNYLNRQRAYYRAWDDSLKKHPQTDGIATGFDFDPIILSQDSDDLALMLKTPPHLLHYTADSAQVGFPETMDGTIGGEPSREVVFNLSRNGKRWLIDAIKLK